MSDTVEKEAGPTSAPAQDVPGAPAEKKQREYKEFGHEEAEATRE